MLTASQASIHSLYTSTGSDRKLIVAYERALKSMPISKVDKHKDMDFDLEILKADCALDLGCVLAFIHFHLEKG